VDVGAQRLQPLLVGDAEALLLVDDDEAEILELDLLASTAWVPTTMSILPSFSPLGLVASLAGPGARAGRPSIGKPWKRSRKVL
jgi:hypothetical protein